MTSKTATTDTVGELVHEIIEIVEFAIQELDKTTVLGPGNILGLLATIIKVRYSRSMVSP